MLELDLADAKSPIDVRRELATQLDDAHEELRTLVDRCDRVASWHETPTFPRPGRSAHFPLREPISFTTHGAARKCTIRSVKLKGVGLCNHVHDVCKPDATEVYRRLHKHLGFDNSLNFAYVESPPCPEGGMFLDRAISEFRNAQVLNDAYGATPFPLAVYRIVDSADRFSVSKFEGNQPLGIAVVGLCNRIDGRASLLMQGASSGTVEGSLGELLAQWLDVLDGGCRASLSFEDRCISSMPVLLSRFGRSLRRFHSAGLYRFSGHLGNIAVSPDSGEVVLLDLDSCRLQCELSKLEKEFQVARDIASGLYGFTSSMLLTYRDGSDGIWSRTHYQQCVEAFLTGYFKDDRPSSLTVEHVLSEILSAVWDEASKFANQTSGDLLSSREDGGLEELEDISFQSFRRRSRYQDWMRRRVTYCYLFCAAATAIRQTSPSCQLSPELVYSKMSGGKNPFLDDADLCLSIVDRFSGYWQ